MLLLLLRMLMQMLILQTHVEMTLCLRQCDLLPRRLAWCNQAPRRQSRWLRSCYDCPHSCRHHHHHHHHHHHSRLVRCRGTRRVWVRRHRRRRPARCRQLLPSSSACVTARCIGGSCASCTSPPVAIALPPPASQALGEVPAAALHSSRFAVAEAAPAAPRSPLQLPSLRLRLRRRRRRPVPAAGGGRGVAADPLPPPLVPVPATPLGEVPAASSRETCGASQSSSAGGRGGVGTARSPGTTDRCEALAPSLP